MISEPVKPKEREAGNLSPQAASPCEPALILEPAGGWMERVPGPSTTGQDNEMQPAHPGDAIATKNSGTRGRSI